MIIKKKIEVMFKFKTLNKSNFTQSLPKILKKLQTLGMRQSNFVSLPTKIQRFTVLRSPHVDKKSREQFELKMYSKLLTVVFDPMSEFDKQTAKLFINFIKNSTAGVQLKISYKV